MSAQVRHRCLYRPCGGLQTPLLCEGCSFPNQLSSFLDLFDSFQTSGFFFANNSWSCSWVLGFRVGAFWWVSVGFGGVLWWVRKKKKEAFPRPQHFLSQLENPPTSYYGLYSKVFSLSLSEGHPGRPHTTHRSKQAL